MQNHTRTILHLDLNAFFASVEQQSNPALRGKAIAVTGRGRTVVTTASYEARAFGVRTGMNTWQARQKCPHIIFVIGDNRKYTYTSSRIVEFMRDYTPMVEVFSIDEAFLDITGSLRLYGGAERIAFLLKERIREAFGLTCSIGIAPNKLLAKLASDMKKPDGLVIITPEEVSRVLERVPAKDLCGVGPKVARQLAAWGVHTCGELGRFPVEILRKRYGVTGERLKLMGQGIDDSPVVPEEDSPPVKSVGHGNTLDQDITDRRAVVREILKLSEMVGRRARRYNVRGKTVSLWIRFADFDTNTGKQTTLPGHTNQTEEIYRAAVSILDQIDLPQPVRLIAVRLTNLTYAANDLPLFPEERKRILATEAMDAVNAKFGASSVTFGTILDEDANSHVIPPAWRPDGVRNIDVL